MELCILDESSCIIYLKIDIIYYRYLYKFYSFDVCKLLQTVSVNSQWNRAIKKKYLVKYPLCK